MALTVVALEIALVLSVAWVAIYSYLINPGHDLVYYQNHAQFASPIVSVVVGMPYLFFACRWVGRKAGTRAVAMCFCVWFILFIIDVLLLAGRGHRVHLGNDGDFPCDEIVGHLLWRQERVERCARIRRLHV